MHFAWMYLFIKILTLEGQILFVLAFSFPSGYMQVQLFLKLFETFYDCMISLELFDKLFLF